MIEVHVSGGVVVSVVHVGSDRGCVQVDDDDGDRRAIRELWSEHTGTLGAAVESVAGMEELIDSKAWIDGKGLARARMTIRRANDNTRLYLEAQEDGFVCYRIGHSEPMRGSRLDADGSFQIRNTAAWLRLNIPAIAKGIRA